MVFCFISQVVHQLVSLPFVFFMCLSNFCVQSYDADGMIIINLTNDHIYIKALRHEVTFVMTLLDVHLSQVIYPNR